MQEDERRESWKSCSTSGRGRQLRDVHPRELFVKASRTIVARRCEEVQTNNVHSNGLAAFPKKRRVADFSAPAALGKVHGPAERHTAECHEPRSTSSFSKITWPETSVSTSIASGGQLITGVCPSRGLIHGSPQTPQVMQSPALSAVYTTESLPRKPRRQEEASSTHCVARGSANFSAPAVKANTSRPLSAQPGLRSAGGPVSRSRGSAASMSAVMTESSSYVWPAAPGGLSRFIDPSTGPAIMDTASIAPKAEEEAYLPAKGPPLRLGLSEWGLPYAITQVRMPIHPLARGAPCPTGVVLCFHFTYAQLHGAALLFSTITGASLVSRGCLQSYAEKGVKEMYPWQSAALECGVDGSNLVYCAPTSGGKSLVAEVLMLRRLLATRRPGARFKHNKQVRRQHTT